ncbi:MAG: hypothetical protein WC860_05305, partial [Candidatus Margulisiibacteriota bacterium]
SSEVDDATAKQLKAGRILIEILKQDKHVPMSIEKQIVSIFLVFSECLSGINVEDTRDIEEYILSSVEKDYPEILEVIKKEGKLSEEFKAELKGVIVKLLDKFQQTK